MKTLWLFAWSLSVLALANTPIGDESASLATAKAVFEKTCSQCHGTDRSLGVTMDRAGWEATVAKMAGQMALPQADQKSIVAFLMAMDVFNATCSKCHGTDRPLGKKKDRAGWEFTVKRMATKTTIPEADQKTIIDYLTTVRGK